MLCSSVFTALVFCGCRCLCTGLLVALLLLLLFSLLLSLLLLLLFVLGASFVQLSGMARHEDGSLNTEVMSRMLAVEAMRRGSMDNITVMVVDIAGGGATAQH